MTRVYHNTESYVALVSKLHENKYDYSKTVFTKMKNIITVICKEHGEFYPIALNHKSTGCPHCYEGRRGTSLAMTEKHFLSRLDERYILKGLFINASTSVNLTCKTHGDFSGIPTRVLMRKDACRGCFAENVSVRASLAAQPRIKKALAALPSKLSCLTVEPTWGEPSRFNCKTHGPFMSRLKELVTYKFGCPVCASESLKGIYKTSFQDYEKFLNLAYPNPVFAFKLLEEDYSKNIGTRLVSMSCSEHGAFSANRSTLNNIAKPSPCPMCKEFGGSGGETELLLFLRTLGVCLAGDRKLLEGKELDILMPEAGVAVEYNGLYWHSSAKVAPDYHVTKLNNCLAKGIELVQVFEDEWLNKREICESILKRKLGVPCKTYYARKLSIETVNFSAVKDFFNINHIQGFVPAQKYLVLRDKETGGVVAASSFSRSRLKNDGRWELVRYCSLLDTVVVGGLSRLAKNFLLEAGEESLISYCCRRWFNGAGYQAAGIKLLAELPPTYFYTNKQLRYSRYVCVKHKLKKLLPKFDEGLTEAENMEANNFLRIYDCGNLLFEFTL